MNRRLNSLWYLSYFPSGVAFGVLSVLAPLYFIEDLGGSLLDLGVMASVATVILMPASVFLRRLPDRYGRSKPLILASQSMAGIILFVMSRARTIPVFQVLYVSLNLTNHMAGPSTSILIAESYERSVWGRAMARQKFMEGLAQAIGLGICTFTAGYLGYRVLLGATPHLVLASLLIALLAIHDPPVRVERFLARIESPVEDLESLSFHMTNGGGVTRPRYGALRWGEEPGTGMFGIGTVLFTLAASNAFSSLPIYLRDKAMLSSSVVFGIFFVRSLVSAFSYLLVSQLVKVEGGRAIKVATTIRIVSAMLLLMIPVLSRPFSILLALALFSTVAFSWSLYSLGTELIRVQQAASRGLGVSDALENMGSSAGGFIGGAAPMLIGFEPIFVISSLLFVFALIFFQASRV